MSPLNGSIRGPDIFKAFGCLIKALRHDERGGFPTENFGNDGGTIKGKRPPL